MKTLYGMVLQAFLPVFLVALLFFVLIMEMVDLFSHISRYLSLDASVTSISMIVLLYLPKCLSFALPISLLFSIAYVLGTYYSNNELISVFGSGISLRQLTMPFLMGGLLLSLGSFLFEDQVVVPTYRNKVVLQREVLQQGSNYSRNNAAIISDQGRTVYYADYYNDSRKMLTGVIILERNSDGYLRRRIDAQSAQWIEGHWELKEARLYYWNTDRKSMSEAFYRTLDMPHLTEPPETFQDRKRDWDQMSLKETLGWINKMKNSGLPFKEIQTDYYKRFSFALTPFIVAVIASALAGRYEKNILLMSLLVSLVVSVVYYVTQMISILMAKLGYIPPLWGAWFPVILAMAAGYYLYRRAKT